MILKLSLVGLVVLCLMVIGLIKQYRILIKLVEDRDFLFDYNNSYVTYLNKYFTNDIYSQEVKRGKAENELHTKLLRQAPKAQRLLLGAGFVDYQPAFAEYRINNYPILVNIVPKLRNPAGLTEEFEWINKILIMQLGQYEELHESMKKEIVNPLILLREGVQFFVTLPIFLLYWTNIIEYSTQNRLSNNIVVKFINFLIIIIGFVSAIVTIVLGWESFKTLLQNLL